MLIDREASKENKDKIIEDIKQRQEDIENGKDKFHLIIYPEGTTSNGFCMMEFKRGGFAALKPVKPVCVKYRGKYFHPTYETLPFAVHTILLLCHLYSSLEIKYLPIFVPNENLYKNKKNLSDRKEMIFAESVREIMEKVSGIKRSTNSLEDKKEYLKILHNQKGFH